MPMYRFDVSLLINHLPMKALEESAVAHLTIDETFSFETIDTMIRYHIQSLYFEEPEETSIHKTSIVLAPSFYNIVDYYIRHSLNNNKQVKPDDLIILCNKFIDNLKRHILLDSVSRKESIGLLFTWVPIIMELHREAIAMSDEVLSNATEYLESKIHEFTMLHLKLSLKPEDKR